VKRSVCLWVAVAVVEAGSVIVGQSAPDEWNVFVAPYQMGATMSATTTMRTVAFAAAAADAAVSHEERQVLATDVLSCASCDAS
jgi:hypothetical protein